MIEILFYWNDMLKFHTKRTDCLCCELDIQALKDSKLIPLILILFCKFSNANGEKQQY